MNSWSGNAECAVDGLCCQYVKMCLMYCRFQAMVPMWDALNHITGHANVRLHHCARKGALRMIATCLITKGEQVRPRGCIAIQYTSHSCLLCFHYMNLSAVHFAYGPRDTCSPCILLALTLTLCAGDQQLWGPAEQRAAAAVRLC